MESIVKSIPNLSKKEFLSIMKVVPIVSVEVLIKEGNEIILGRRSTEPFKGMWQLTGGVLYYNEKISDAVMRVAKRETGAGVEIVKFLKVYEYINNDPRGHIIALAHIAKIIGGNLTPNPDNYELEYFKMPPKDMIPYQKKIFSDALTQ